MNNDGLAVSSALMSVIDSHMAYIMSKAESEGTPPRIIAALKVLLNGAYVKYVFTENETELRDKLSNESLQAVLSTLNERGGLRKTRGVYYTPPDVTSYIIGSCFQALGGACPEKGDRTSGTDWVRKTLDAVVFDPTCGSGEFLYDALKVKIDILEAAGGPPPSEEYLGLVQTIKGNDIDAESVEITKIRLFFEIVDRVDDCDFDALAGILNKNLFVGDFICGDPTRYGEVDVVVGNPPYVEDSKYEGPLPVRYGNVYANVMDNSMRLLKDGGVMGMIVPLSYISTPRMNKIRSLIRGMSDMEAISNFSDRPDCLFSSVHQKLSITIVRKGQGRYALQTSGYNYWHESERAGLFDGINLMPNVHTFEGYYPKIGDPVSKGIFEKVYAGDGRTLWDELVSGGDAQIHVNMRATFWVKAFSFNPGSREYKTYSVPNEKSDFLLALVNSSLFFWYWTVVSDCWHITAKEWGSFRAPDGPIDVTLFRSLRARLEESLEETKEYVGTAQTEYEYKHKFCKGVIDEIDDAVAPLLGLSESEVQYIKGYALKYRESRGG